MAHNFHVSVPIGPVHIVSTTTSSCFQWEGSDKPTTLPVLQQLADKVYYLAAKEPVIFSDVGGEQNMD